MSEEVIYWHLPGLCYYGVINQLLIDAMHKYPDKFRDHYKIGSVYGTFPGAIWNGGRNIIAGFNNKKQVKQVLDYYNGEGIPARFTWTNVLLEEKHVYDSYCNMIMEVGHNGLNQVLVNRPVLEDYVRKEYPKYKIISSTTKRILNLETLKEELKKDYYLVVLDYDLNHNEQVINDLLPYADRLEILVNETCVPNCPKRVAHYVEISRAQLEFDVDLQFPCCNTSPTKNVLSTVMKRPSFMTNEDVDRYAKMGYKNFKIVGRGANKQFVIDSYIYFLVKEEHRDFIRNYFMSSLARFAR